MVDQIRRRFAFIFLCFAIIFFYVPFLFSLFKPEVKVPFPADTIVGLYSPYREFYADTYPNGIPFKNFLITDPARQTYVWRELAINIWKDMQIPSWNPYEMTGKPLAGNFQSSVFYPLNLLLLFPPFPIMWSILILAQTALAGIFTYVYLRNLKLEIAPASIASSAFVFSGFSISWLEWGTVLQTALWLPIILLSIDKFFTSQNKIHVKFFPQIDKRTIWLILFTFFTSSSLLGGHLQTFFYLYIMVLAYFFLRFLQYNRGRALLVKFLIANIVSGLLTFIQWFPTLRFILLSARNIDQNYLQTEGWFIPFSHLLQFIAPDFFGNPSTLNYWGTWNYGEMVGYIGILPLILAIYSIFNKNRTVIFFGISFILSLIMVLPTGISSLPFILNIPFISSAQPTRLLFLIVFSLCILSAYGTSFIMNIKKFEFGKIIPLLFPIIILMILWMLIYLQPLSFFIDYQNILIAKRNLIFPTVVLSISVILISGMLLSKRKLTKEILMVMILLVSLMELLRFAQKFTPFVESSLIYPNTRVLDFLQNDQSPYRIAVMDRRIMPPNFFTHYKIQTIEGYDPLYLKSYADYIVALERNKADLSQPYGINRIITPHNFNSNLFNFLNTKYILSFDELKETHLEKVFEEGNVKVYENKKAYPRVYFVENVINAENVLEEIFRRDLLRTAVLSQDDRIPQENLVKGSVRIDRYKENSINMSTSNKGDGFLVISDAYYPTWKVYIDGMEAKIYRTNHSFRGVYIPRGDHAIIMKDSFL